MTPTEFATAHGDPTTWSSADIEAFEHTVETHSLPAVTLTKDAVTLYDISTNRVWGRMSHRDAETDLDLSREMGDTLQEYDTTDRYGHPLRIVLEVVRTDETRGIYDAGGVYVFAH